MTLNSAELRKIDAHEAQAIGETVRRHPIYIILENVLDTYNIGGFFRLADAVAAEKLYLCGDCAIPPDHKIVKASVGTYKFVPWEHKTSVRAALVDLRSVRGLQVVAIEQHPDSTNYRKADYDFPLAFVFGHETNGITPETLELVDEIIEIPMYGVNKSLNVMVAAGIAVYWALDKCRRDKFKLLRGLRKKSGR